MRRPSPAMVVAVLALVIACAGTATAATLLTGKDIANGSLSSADVRDRSLRGKDLRSNTLTGRNVKNLSGRDVMPNGLDGSDIDEDTLSPVPNAVKALSAETAARADRAAVADAVAGATPIRVFSEQQPDTSTVTVYEAGGLLIRTACSVEGRIALKATPAVPGGGYLRVAVQRPGAPAETTFITDNTFEGTDSANLVAGGGDNVAGTLTYRSAAGQVTTLQYLAHQSGGCVVAGNALLTTP